MQRNEVMGLLCNGGIGLGHTDGAQAREVVVRERKEQGGA
jgi:hypothetical protein